ncbi:MAG: primosomal protein N' [Campylobacterales bacterium]|nr:primosomal protein N' [Campylobacterales bacterium]
MYTYQVALSRSSAPLLTYSFKDSIKAGTIVKVPMKSTIKEAVVLEEVDAPDFETSDILEVTSRYFDATQLEIVKFISTYYFSTIGEALALFVPYDSEIEYVQISIDPQPPKLTKYQQSAFNAIQKEDISLLFGVTGSGKSEIFISLICETLKEGKNALLLMPEISLTPQMQKRLEHYFGLHVVIWHSRLTKKQKEVTLAKILSGEARVVAGARSALFTPLKDIGLIVVDEEHDDSYKSMSKPRYNARDVALFIAKKIGAKVLLCSATPQVNSYYKYPVIKLDKTFIKTKKEYRFIEGDSINTDMLSSIEAHHKNDGQILVFLPTRGSFKYLYCKSCGESVKCPFCSVGMALHRRHRHLRCHYCGFTQPIIEECPSCGYAPLSSERLGTAEAIELISEAIEDIVIEQFDKDSITTHKKLTEALGRFESGESRVLLGTQMLSKGHDYGNITLSVIMGLDYIISLADYRAKERALSLLFQVAGRSGRAKEAEVIIQSAQKETYEGYLGDYELFLKDELSFREMASYPPFSNLARVLIIQRDIQKAKDITHEITDKLKNIEGVEVVGSGAAPIERIANNYRYHIVLRSHERGKLLRALHSINERAVTIDMDPIDFS